MEELKNYMIVHKNEEGNTIWSIPNLELPIKKVVNATCRNNEHYVFITSSLEDFGFATAYDVDFSLPSGSISPILFDVEIAKETFKTHIRNARNELFPDLDVQYMRALESDSQTKAQEIVAKKQILRNLTEMDLSDVSTLSELKDKWPADILGPSLYEK
jgi:hypothetical protein